MYFNWRKKERGIFFVLFCFVFLFVVRGPLTVVASPVAEQQAPDVQAQRPWLTGPAAPRHVGSSQTGAGTRVPCIGRWTLNHCATREALPFLLESSF